MTELLPLSYGLQILATAVRNGDFDRAEAAQTLDRMSEFVGRIEIEVKGHREIANIRALHRVLEEHAIKALHSIGAMPAEAAFKPIKTATDLKPDNVTPLRPRDHDKP